MRTGAKGDFLVTIELSGYSEEDEGQCCITVDKRGYRSYRKVHVVRSWGPEFTRVTFKLRKNDTDILEKGDISGTAAGDINEALLSAAASGFLDVVEMLLERGPDLNVMDEDGETALWEASLNGHLDIVKLLVEKGADLNARARDGLTALGRALKSGHGDIVKFLKAHGAKE